jgi:hypothetical protein
MANKTYLVKTWNADGSLANHYEVSVESDAQLADLKKFLKSKDGHVLITRQPDRPAPKKRSR